MKRPAHQVWWVPFWLIVIVTACVLVLISVVNARADERASLANALLAESLADDVTSQTILEKPGTFERNPLEHTLANRLASAALWQLFARNPHTSLRFVRGAVTLYPVVLLNNIRILFELK